MITKRSLISFIRTIFQLIVAGSAMYLSIYYCINYASMFAQFLGGELDPDTGGLGLGFFLVMYLYPSLPFLIFSATWIRKNCTSILFCYFITVFVVNIIVYHLTNKTSLIGGFIFQSMMLSPLIILVSTTAHYTASIFQRWRGQR
jgi:glucan phosphoethanolaminetransferase (alkaline phosphatase superfamily)